MLNRITMVFCVMVALPLWASDSRDSIAPTIQLNTPDTVYHTVNTHYTSVKVTVTDNFYPNSQVSVSCKSMVNPFALGIYTEEFTAMDGSGNIATKTRYVVVRDAPSGMAIQPINPLTVKVYPNPFTNKITITTPMANTPITFINSHGQLIWSGLQIEAVDFSNLPAGIYFVEVGGVHTRVVKE